MSWLSSTVKTFTKRRCQIPISEGGATFAWNSPLVMVMLSVGGAMILLFLLVEWRFARLPIMPSESMLSSSQKKPGRCPNGLNLQRELFPSRL